MSHDAPRRRRSTGWVALGLLVITAGPLAAATSNKDEEGKPPVVLETYKIEDLPLTSFGISLEIAKDNTTRKVISMRISEVRKGSDAESKGLRPRMRIDTINGTPVEHFDASFRHGSELNRIFGPRKAGAVLMLTVVGIRGQFESSTVTLVETDEAHDYHRYLSPPIFPTGKY